MPCPSTRFVSNIRPLLLDCIQTPFCATSVGFLPFGDAAKNGRDPETLAISELKNGRLAMIGLSTGLAVVLFVRVFSGA